MGAQINAFFFESYKPLSDGLGTYINHMYTEYGDGGDTHRPLYESESDIQQQQPSLPTTTTTMANTSRSPQRNVWLKKLWPSKVTSTTDQDEESDNIN